MTESPSWDVLVVGGGPAGYFAAIRAAHLGGRVALVERDAMGGVCLNRGCIPTKALLHVAHLAAELGHAADLGLNVRLEGVDEVRMWGRKDEVVARLSKGTTFLVEKAGCTILRGNARLVAPTEVEITDGEGEVQRQAARAVILATGSAPSHPPIPGLRGADGALGPGVHDSDSLLAAPLRPPRLLVVGGGAVGLEFADVFRSLGSQVTVLELMPQLVPGEDAEVVEHLRRALVKRGIKVDLRAALAGLDEAPDGFTGGGLCERTAHWQVEGQEAQSGQFDAVLVATGRRPLTEGLGLEGLGVAMSGSAVKVSSRMRTNLEGLFAVGDLAGPPMLAHKGSAEGLVAAAVAMGGDAEMDYHAVPRAIYTSPEVAAIGLTEEQARERAAKDGDDVLVGRFPLSASGKALAEGHTEGLAKVISTKRYGEVVGVAMCGAHATELVAEGALAMRLDGTWGDLAHAMHPHPTLSEALAEAAAAVGGEAISMPRPDRAGG